MHLCSQCRSSHWVHDVNTTRALWEPQRMQIIAASFSQGLKNSVWLSDRPMFYIRIFESLDQELNVFLRLSLNMKKKKNIFHCNLHFHASVILLFSVLFFGFFFVCLGCFLILFGFYEKHNKICLACDLEDNEK